MMLLLLTRTRKRQFRKIYITVVFNFFLMSSDEGTLDFIMPHGYLLNPDSTPHGLFLDRLSLADTLFREGYASHILISGRHGKLDGQAKTTEAEVMRDYFLAHGIPERCLVGSPVGDNTFECMEYARGIIISRGWNSGVMVSHNEHLERIRAISHVLFSGMQMLLCYKGVPITDSVLRSAFLEHERSSLEEISSKAL